MNIIESLFSRHLVIGGDDDNQNLWMSDSRGETWRKSVPLPYGPGSTSYGASLFQREHKVKKGRCNNTFIFLSISLPNVTGLPDWRTW